MSVKVRVNQQDYGQKIVFAFIKESQDPGKYNLFNGKDKWEELEYGQDNPDKVTLVIPPEAKEEILQQMADMLYAMGFKPAKLKAVQSEMDRLDNHLMDTIAIRDRLLVIIEKKGQA